MVSGFSGNTQRLRRGPLRSPLPPVEVDRSSATTRASSSGLRSSSGSSERRSTRAGAADLHREIKLTCVGVAVTLIASLGSIPVVALRLSHPATVTWLHVIAGLVITPPR